MKRRKRRKRKRMIGKERRKKTGRRGLDYEDLDWKEGSP